MNQLVEKLKGIPHVYYFNLDNRTDRKKYMENQFNYWGIPFTRVSQNKYLAREWKKWKHLVKPEIEQEGSDEKKVIPIPFDKNHEQYEEAISKENTENMLWHTKKVTIANTISHIDFLKRWYEETDEELLIIMEDDYDLSLISQWTFDWEYLMSKIPYDWDCVQLGFQSFVNIKCFLHPKEPTQNLSGGFGPCLLNRRYVSKIIDLHYRNGFFRLDGVCADKYLFQNVSDLEDKIQRQKTLNVEYIIVENGRTYCLPLIPMDNDFGSYEDDVYIFYFHHVVCREIYYHWWNELQYSFSLDDFFSYNKPNDWNMTYDVNQVAKKLGIEDLATHQLQDLKRNFKN